MLYQSLFFILALWFGVVSASVQIPLQSCSTGSDIITGITATANVWPPVKGQEFTVDLSATVTEDINGGTYELKVAFDSIPLIDKTGSLTDLNVTFPIKAGPLSLSKSVQFPSIPISGAIDITIQAKDNNGNEIVCEKISLNLAAKKPIQAKAVNIPYTSCASGTDIATLSQVTANEWPPVKGTDLVITVYGTLSKAVTNGTYEIKAVFDGILPVLDQKGDLSALTTLPLAAGPITVSKTQNLPSIIPSGSLEITITATDEDGEQILCIKVSVTLAEPVAVKTPVQIPYTSCASGTDIATLSQVTANEWPPVKGTDLVITVYGTLSKAVTNGTYEIKAVFDGIIPVLDQKGDLSALTTLPLAAGPITVSKTQNLPSIIPSGSLEITITATSEDGEQILCIKVSVTLAAPVPAINVANVPVPYDSCGSSSDIATLESVTANEWPPKKNSDLSITANGNLSQSVTSGTYEIKAKFDGIQILKKHGNLSDLATLPLAAGPITISKTVHLPKSIPSGKIQIEVTASNGDGTQILCFKVSVHIKAPAPAPQPSLPHPHRPVSHGFPIIVSPFKVTANVPLPSSDYSNCGTSADLMPFVSVSASSWPPVSGSSLEMTTTFDAKETVTGGTYHYKAEYMGIVVQDKSDTLENAGFKVPISTGAYSITQTVNAPSGLPAGHIVTTTSATDANGKQLFCFVVQFDI